MLNKTWDDLSFKTSNKGEIQDLTINILLLTVALFVALNTR